LELGYLSAAKEINTGGLENKTMRGVVTLGESYGYK
jgi:hypothetical protein